MYRALATGPIGVRVPFAVAVQLAAAHGFQGIAVSMADIEQLGIGGVRRLLEESSIIPALTGMPVNFRQDDAAFEQDMTKLPAFVRTMATLGCTRMATWFKPWHETLSYKVRFEQMRIRMARICAVLAEHGLRFGLEFVGTPTFRKGKPNPFIHDIDGLLELVRAVGADNLGFLLDSFHWYTSGGDAEDLDKLSNQLVVVVHVNDAAAGVLRQEQMDQVRAMPGETGVVDIATFMRALDNMDYDGPVIVEPFCDWVRALPPDEAVAATARSLDKIWEIAGV